MNTLGICTANQPLTSLHEYLYVNRSFAKSTVLGCIFGWMCQQVNVSFTCTCNCSLFVFSPFAVQMFAPNYRKGPHLYAFHVYLSFKLYSTATYTSLRGSNLTLRLPPSKLLFFLLWLSQCPLNCLQTTKSGPYALQKNGITIQYLFLQQSPGVCFSVCLSA